MEPDVRTIAIINQKGGCGKTTSAVNLAAVFASRGYRTLLVDMDPQSHCAAGLGVPEEQIERDIGDAMLTPATRALDATRLLWRIGRGFDLAPSRMRLAALEAARGGLADQPDKERRLLRTLERLDRDQAPKRLDGSPGSTYDVCLIDCPPSIGLLTYNALAAAREVLIPVETSFFSLRGAGKQVNTIRSLGRRLGLRFRPRLLATMHDASVPLAKDLLNELKTGFGDAMVPVSIRYDVALKEAAAFGQPVATYAPESAGAKDYLSLCEWLVEQAGIEQAALIEDEPIEAIAGRLDFALGRRDNGSSHAPRPKHDGDLADDRAQMGDAEQAETSRGLIEVRPLRPVGTSGREATLSRLEELAQRARALQMNRRVERPAATGTDGPTMAVEAPLSAPAASVAAQALKTQSSPPAAGETATAAPETTTMLTRTMLVGRPVALELVGDSAAEQAAESDAKGRTPDSVRGLFGVRATSTGALFVQPIALGSTIAIAGTFNGWDPERNVMRANATIGVQELHLQLPAGRHEYRLVIDGRWTIDTFNTDRTPHDGGDVNNVIELPSRG